VQPGNSGGPLVTEAGQVIGVVVQRLSDLGMLEATGMVAQSVTPDISQEFCFGRPFCPAAAFWRQNVLERIFKYGWRSFSTCGLAAGQNFAPKRFYNPAGISLILHGRVGTEGMTIASKPCEITGL
jgi:hypothetical protein